MKKVQQKHNGCVLATLAMLANISYEEAEEQAKVAVIEAGLCWDGDWWNTFGYVTREVFQVIANVTASQLGMAEFMPVTRVRDVQSTGDSPNLCGKGQVSVEFDVGGHSMAYEDGLVYDPNYSSDQGETWDAYLQRRGSENILKVVVTPLGNTPPLKRGVPKQHLPKKSRVLSRG